MEQFVSFAVAPRRFNFLLFAIFSVTALLLAVAGLYSVISYGVTERRLELGIRIALGAQPRDVLRLIVGQAFKPVGSGVAIGLLGAGALARTMTSLLYGVSAGDGMTYSMAAGVLLLVALLATYVPARRATKLDPMIALRGQ